MKKLFLPLTLLLLLATAPLRSEEPPINTKSYTPSPFTHGILSTHDGQIMDFLEMNMGLSLMYGHKPLVLEFADSTGTTTRNILEHKFEADLSFAIGLWKYIDVALNLPINLYHGGEGLYNAKMHAAGIGDMAFYPRVGYTFEKDKVSIAFIPEVTIPTGRQVDRLMGYATATFVPTFAVSAKLGDFGIATDLFYRLMDKRELADLTAGDEVGFKLAGRYTPITPLDVEAEFIVRTVATKFFSASNAFFIDGNAGVQYRIPEVPGLMVHGGAGWGMTQGYGLPIVRVFTGLVYNIPEKVEEPKPEPQPEPKPEPVAPPPPPAPKPEPPKDTDGDGLIDTADKCPEAAEDKDGFEDADGCPDPDNDGDTVLDEKDSCPTEEETVNGFMDEDGCPDKAPEKKLEKIVVTEKEIEIKDQVLFALNKADISSKSFAMLDEIAAVLIANPKIKLAIEGHTDNLGKPAANKKLSQDRANSVMNYLIKKGVDPDRLTAEGFGQERPIADNATKPGREANRRVEFHIVK
ncbi:MAG TPA: OmpA family protein [bacterium]|nr:OmpA family protein [bacterium]